jgi:hypothetical protein
MYCDQGPSPNPSISSVPIRQFLREKAPEAFMSHTLQQEQQHIVIPPLGKPT